MYLNDFRVSEILDVIEDIKSSRNTDLLYKINVTPDDERKIAYLHYIPYLHRLDAFYFDVELERLYPNPQAKTIMMPREEFVKNLVPDDTF